LLKYGSRVTGSIGFVKSGGLASCPSSLRKISGFPEKVAGLVYLDAATGFALYDPAHPLLEVEMNDIKRRIDEIEAGGVDEQKKLLELESAPHASNPLCTKTTRESRICRRCRPARRFPLHSISACNKYTSIPVPVLAIYACPHNWDRMPDSAGKTVLLGRVHTNDIYLG
jgi:non-heme chloroperoxidase